MHNANIAAGHTPLFQSARRIPRLAVFPLADVHLLFMATLGSAASAQPAKEKRVGDQVVTELIVLYDDKTSVNRATSEEILDAIRNPGRSSRNVVLNLALNSPKSARNAIGHRHNQIDKGSAPIIFVMPLPLTEIYSQRFRLDCGILLSIFRTRIWQDSLGRLQEAALCFSAIFPRVKYFRDSVCASRIEQSLSGSLFFTVFFARAD